MEPRKSKPSLWQKQARKATAWAWGAVIALWGVFGLFKGPDAWYANLFEAVAWLATVTLVVLILLWHFAAKPSPRRSRRRPRVLEAEGPRYDSIEAIKREASARGVTERDLLGFERWRAFLIRAALLVRDLPRSEINGDVLIARIDGVLHAALNQPLPLFLSMYDTVEPTWDFELRPSAFEDGYSLLTQLAEDARPWSLPAGVSLDLLDEAEGILDSTQGKPAQ